MEFISGFSKMNKLEKRQWLTQALKTRGEEIDFHFDEFNVSNDKLQKGLDEFSENTIANFPLPYGLAPNFVINGDTYTIPMVCEESSVVAAASKSAKFWKDRGGFKARVIADDKLGHVHFFYSGEKKNLNELFESQKMTWLSDLANLEENMKKRGGGVRSLNLIDHTDKLQDYYTLEMVAGTCDAMGANFLNTLLERLAELLSAHKEVDVLMSILSNFNENCLVEVKVDCPVADLSSAYRAMSAEQFAKRFCQGVEIARVNPKRAVTHNKGIMNGIDAVVLATGNDFRAIEACAHAYGAKDGQYRSLSRAYIKENHFYFTMTLPLALGTTGGLTSLHPLAKHSLQILGYPNAKKLMEIAACVGLAQNFGAVKSLITSGIQKGHMKMHLLNILRSLEANPEEEMQCKKYFSDKVICVKSVREYLLSLRKMH